MSGKKGNSADEGVRIDGGAGGTIASIDDLQRLVGLVSAAVHDLDAACKGANQLVSWSGNQIRRSETESANVTEARTAVIKAAAEARWSASSPARCRHEAKALCDALDKTIDQYEKAELAVAAEMSTLEKWLLYGLDSLGFPFNPLARKAATIALTRWLLDELERTRLRRGYLADTLRKYHPLVRELLDHMVVAHPILAAGPASTRRLTTIFGIMGTIITRGLGYWAARIRRVSTTKEILKGGLADLVDRVDKADWQVKHVTPSILVSKVVTGAGKKASWIVSLPPTTPLIGGSNPMDLVSDIQGMGELPNDLVDGVLKALSDAGVKKGEQILMIGHSLGGITAAAVASCKEFRSQYSPAAIITLGSPIASIKIPEDVKVLALEHRQDVFPALAGAPNPQTPNFVTVTRDLAISNNTAESDAAKQFMGTDAHAREFYRNTLAMVDKMNDPSIKAFKQAIAPIMVRGASVTTTQYEVVRSGVRSQ